MAQGSSNTPTSDVNSDAPRLKQPIDELQSAESLISLLGHLDLRKVPAEEIADLAAVQTQALETILAAHPVPELGDPGTFRFSDDTADLQTQQSGMTVDSIIHMDDARRTVRSRQERPPRRQGP